jgi:parallel beta-helix repeat protein
MPQFASYPLTTTLAPNDLLLIHQNASGVEKTVKYSDLVSSSYVINVKAYGAVGNGTTDDSAAVQAAFNAAIPGSVVLFPASATAYIINTAINVPISNITVVGYGATLSNTADTQYKKFNVNGPKGFIRFEGLAFAGGYSSMAPVVNNGTIAITNSSQITVNNCWFYQTNAAGVIIAGDSFDVAVTNCKFFSTYIGVITAVTGGNKPFNINISNNFFRTGLGTTSSVNSGAVILSNTAPFGSGAGIVVSGNEIRSYGKYGVYLNTAVHNSIVSDNFISGTGIGVQVEASTGVVVSGNTLRDIVNEGILVQNGSDNVNVSGNVLNTTDSNSNGIKFSSVTNGTASGNNVTSNGDGLVVINSPTATITGNTFSSSGEQVVIVGGGIAIISNFVISGNSLIAGGVGTRYHIKLDSGGGVINNGLITSNFFAGSVTDAGINLYAPSGNSINDINITGNNTTNAVAGSGYLLDFGGTVNPAVVLNRIWCSGNTGIPNDLSRSLNVDYLATSSSIAMPYVWFAYQNGTIGVDASGGARSVELPPSGDYPGWRVTIIKTDSSTNAVTISGYGGTNINGQATYVLRAQGESVTLVNGVTEWRIENVVNHSYSLVYRGTNQTVTSGVETDIIWQNVTNNGANAWNAGTPERLYVPAGAKRVRLSANFRIAYSTSGTKRIMRLKASGGSVPVFATFSGSPSGGIPASFGLASTITTPILKVSDLPDGSSGYFYLTFEHDAGGTLDIFGNQDHTNFQIEVIE